MSERRPDAATLVAFAGFVILAGGNGTAIALTLREMPPFWAATCRFLPSAWMFLVLALATNKTFPRGRALVGAALYGLLAFFGTFGLIYWALRVVKPGLAQVVLALAPLVTLLLATLQRQERFRWRALGGALACLAGVAFMFHEKVAASAPLTGLLALLGATFCLSEATVVGKNYPKADIVTTNVIAMTLAGVLFLALSVATHEDLGMPNAAATWWALAYIVVVGSVIAFALYLFVLQRWTASAAAYQWVLLPLVAVPLSAALTGERVTLALLVGGTLVLAGVYMGAIWRPRARPPTPAAGPSDA